MSRMNFDFSEFVDCISQKALVWVKRSSFGFYFVDDRLSVAACSALIISVLNPHDSVFSWQRVNHARLFECSEVGLPWHTLFNDVTEHFIQPVRSLLTCNLTIIEIVCLHLKYFFCWYFTTELCPVFFGFFLFFGSHTKFHAEANPTTLFLWRLLMAASSQAPVVLVLLSANRQGGKQDRTAGFK